MAAAEAPATTAAEAVEEAEEEDEDEVGLQKVVEEADPLD